MRTSQSFGVHFTIKKEKAKDDVTKVYACITINKDRIHFALKHYRRKCVYELIETAVKRLQEKQVRETGWISYEEVMKLLHIKSKATLQKLRDTGKIRYSQYGKKIILYEKASALDFLERYACETF